MSIKQQIISKLNVHGVVISGNDLEGYLFEYKKKYKGRFKGIDLLFDMLDYEECFTDFLIYINLKQQ